MDFKDKLEEALNEGKEPHIQSFNTPAGTITTVVLDFDDFKANIDIIMPALVEVGADVDALMTHGQLNSKFNEHIAPLYDKYNIPHDHIFSMAVRGIASRLLGGVSQSPDKATTRVMSDSPEIQQLNKLFDDLPAPVQMAIEYAVEGLIKVTMDEDAYVAKDIRMSDVTQPINQAVATIGRAANIRSALAKHVPIISKAINDFFATNRHALSQYDPLRSPSNRDMVSGYLRRLFALMTSEVLKPSGP